MTKPKVTWTKCNGEAHDPAVGGMIDNCYSCAPYWGMIPRCAKGHMVSSKWSNEKQMQIGGYCEKCKKHYDLDTKPTNRDLEVIEIK